MFIFLNVNNLTGNKNYANIRNVNVVLSSKIRGKEKMNKANLEYWIDKEGNKVYGNPKKYNKSLEYLISDNPEDVISKRGIKLRKMFHPIFVKLLPLTSQNKLKIVKDGFGEYEIPKDKKIIYVASHGFKDDIALSLMAAKYHAYMVFASIPDFFYTIDGYALWANGVFLMDRKDEASKKALLSKVKYGFEQGLKRVIICPEGVWNKDPNEVILDLWKGSYLAAKENDALIVPISLLNKDMRLDGDRPNNKKGTCYATVGNPIDVSTLDEKEAIELIRDTLATGKYNLMEKYSKADRDSLGYNPDEYWEEYVSELIKNANTCNACRIVTPTGEEYIAPSRAYDYEIENTAQFIRDDKIDEYDVFKTTNENVKVTPDNMKVLCKTLSVANKTKDYYEE